MALAIFIGSSSISTTSAASMAASEPMAPMAMPMSARPSTGASLMPSPTKASFSFSDLFFSSSSTFATLSAGSSSLYTSSMLQLSGHLFGHLAGVAGEHDSSADSGGLQRLNGLPGMGLHHIRDHDMSGIFSVHAPYG